jgi:hypothetical protein
MIHKAIVKQDVNAYTAILDRLEGKPKASIDMNVDSTKHNLRYADLEALEKRFKDNGLSLENEDLE